MARCLNGTKAKARHRTFLQMRLWWNNEPIIISTAKVRF